MLEAVKKEGDKAVEKTQKNCQRVKEQKKFVSLDDYIIERVKKEISDILVAKFSFW